jgi:hypothetical protein
LGHWLLERRAALAEDMGAHKRLLVRCDDGRDAVAVRRAFRARAARDECDIAAAANAHDEQLREFSVDEWLDFERGAECRLAEPTANSNWSHAR